MRLQLLINSSRSNTINHTKFSFLCSIYLSLLYLFIPWRAKVFGSRLFCDLGGSRLDLWQPISGDQNGWLGFGGEVKRLCVNRLSFEKVRSSPNASDRQGQHRSSVMDVCHTCPRWMTSTHRSHRTEGSIFQPSICWNNTLPSDLMHSGKPYNCCFLLSSV